MQDAPFKYPRAAVGHIFAVSSLVFGVAAWIVGPGHELITPTLQTLCFAYAVIAWAYLFWSVYRIHKILSQATNLRYPVRPVRAAVLGLVPFFNFYWMFKWTGEIAAFLNHVRREDRFPLDRWGWILFLGVIPGALLPGLPLIAAFIVIGRVVAKTQITLAARTLPIESYDRPVYRNQTGVVTAWITSVFLVMAGAAVVTGTVLRGAAGRDTFLPFLVSS